MLTLRHRAAAPAAALTEALRPRSASGGLVDPKGPATPQRIGQLWSPFDRARLLAIRDRFDPDGRFVADIVIG